MNTHKTGFVLKILENKVVRNTDSNLQLGKTLETQKFKFILQSPKYHIPSYTQIYRNQTKELQQQPIKPTKMYLSVQSTNVFE